MKGKPKKWAAKSLVSETERKAIPTPKQQRKLGVLTAGAILGGGGAGFLAKQVGKQVGKKVATRAADKKARKIANEKTSKKKAEIEEKKSSEKILNAKFEDDLLRAYNKAHPRSIKARHEKEANEWWQKQKKLERKERDIEAQRLRDKRTLGRKQAKQDTEEFFKRILKNKGNSKKPKKAKGGYVKKYAKGGSVRAARF